MKPALFLDVSPSTSKLPDWNWLSPIGVAPLSPFHDKAPMLDPSGVPSGNLSPFGLRRTSPRNPSELFETPQILRSPRFPEQLQTEKRDSKVSAEIMDGPIWKIIEKGLPRGAPAGKGVDINEEIKVKIEPKTQQTTKVNPKHFSFSIEQQQLVHQSLQHTGIMNFFSLQRLAVPSQLGAGSMACSPMDEKEDCIREITCIKCSSVECRCNWAVLPAFQASPPPPPPLPFPSSLKKGVPLPPPPLASIRASPPPSPLPSPPPVITLQRPSPPPPPSLSAASVVVGGKNNCGKCGSIECHCAMPWAMVALKKSPSAHPPSTTLQCTKTGDTVTLDRVSHNLNETMKSCSLNCLSDKPDWLEWSPMADDVTDQVVSPSHSLMNGTFLSDCTDDSFSRSPRRSLISDHTRSFSHSPMRATPRRLSPVKGQKSAPKPQSFKNSNTLTVPPTALYVSDSDSADWEGEPPTPSSTSTVKKSRVGTDALTPTKLSPKRDRTHKKPRNLWTPEEDQKLAQQIAIHGPKHWSTIAQNIGVGVPEFLQRTGKQCRERWHNHLDPSLNKGSWTLEEDMTLIRAHGLGMVSDGCWADIAKELPGRSDNAVKNRWHLAMTRAGRCKKPDPNLENDTLFAYCLSILRAQAK